MEYQSQWITAPEVPLSIPDLYQSTASPAAPLLGRRHSLATPLGFPQHYCRISTPASVNVTIHVKGRVRGIIGALKSAPWSLDFKCQVSLPSVKLAQGFRSPVSA
ncbi:hypothetical protein PanWU01x14_013790 [Parasponia andersonii]|uniref:Uncharacterized protein n=1 Tax=Parasponia andersonii TaxID=3476 RepID=A0A2P5E145_PARAD|nr:hypothetical protein PanWU01x14_013790 [Parasponia andersonii]